MKNIKVSNPEDFFKLLDEFNDKQFHLFITANFFSIAAFAKLERHLSNLLEMRLLFDQHAAFLETQAVDFRDNFHNEKDYQFKTHFAKILCKTFQKFYQRQGNHSLFSR